MSTVDLSRFVTWTEVQDGQRYRVGSGDSRFGLRGKQIGVIAFKHSPGYEVVLQLDNGRIDSFSPMQLYPEPA